ncbi:RcpC/CpaB family pilus assembly protein [Streptomyces sp. NPDC051320]|uniref:RcpC/CpaB family pilus assembly protein n=1 Tax=Streptomyces sp. NPDC051320 TaxID=3154644 RepID=UPI003443D2B3
MIPMPVPVVSAPEPRGVPLFAPLRVRGGRQRLRRALRRRHRALSAGLVVTAAALVAWAPPDRGDPDPPAAPPAHAARAAPGAADHRPAVRAGGPDAGKTTVVSAPVRIADAATVRLLEPGDRVDVIATGDPDRAPNAGGTATEARVVATGVRVTGVPDAGSASPTGGGGALIVLAVSRSTATALAGAAAHSDLAVTLC